MPGEAPGLADTDPPPAHRPLKLGDTGIAVVSLQRALNVAGASPAVGTDGKFGPKTQAAVRYVQLAAGLQQTGVADDAVWAVLEPAMVVPTPAPITTPTGESPFVAAVLACAKADLGIHETGHNDGPEIRALYLKPLGLSPGSNWCAAAVSSWLRRASAQTGIKSPVTSDAGAKALMAKFKAAGRLIERRDLKAEDIVAGVVVFWDRAPAGQPTLAWYGHVGVATSTCVGVAFSTIEGNSGASGEWVATMPRTLADPRLLGIGRL